MDSHPDSSLLRLAYSQLYPDIFSHPVWIYFGDAGTSDSTELIQTLMRTCDQLKTHEDQSTVCQLLLICAVLQLRSGDHNAAITVLDKAIEIGERNGVSAIDCWARWGMSAVYIQLGKWQEAAKQLIHLKTEFAERGEWVLANIMEMICEYLLRNSFTNYSSVPNKPISLPTEPLLKEALSWLKDWGTPPKLIDNQSKDSIGHDDKDDRLPDSSRPMISISCRIRNLLSTIKRLALGELRLKLVETRGQSRPVPYDSRQYTGDQAIRAMDDYLQSNPTFPYRVSSVEELMESNIKTSEFPVLPTATIIYPISEQSNTPRLAVYTLGNFQVFKGETLIENWSSRKALLIFKYILTYLHSPVSKDVLMDVFWPDADSEAARRNLHQAIYALRQTLKTNSSDFQWIQFENDSYRLNQEVDLWLDHQEFDKRYKSGIRLEHSHQIDKAMKEYQVAKDLYQGHYYIEELYEDWALPHRQYLWQNYLYLAIRLAQYHLENLEISEAMAISQRILAWDECQEEAHQLLMKCYLARGQRHLAIHQYRICVQALNKEMDVKPSEKTVALYQQLKKA